MDEILLLEPLLVEKVWGGERLFRFLSREGARGAGECYGEAWLLYVRDDGASVVRGGEFDGRSLVEIAKEEGVALFGRRFAGRRFPLLCKIIAAEKGHLSLQLHPDGAAVAQFGETDAPKNELWYLLEALRQPSLVIGLTGSAEAGDKILEPSVLKSALNRIEASAGEAFYIKAGVPHSALAGTVLFEVSNNSNLTYRMFDWERSGRELHREKALSSIRSPIGDAKLRGEVSYSRSVETTRYVTEFCTLEQFDIMGDFNILPVGVFRFGLVLWGKAEIGGVSVSGGDSFFVPAAASALQVAVTEPTRLLLVTPA